MSSALLKAAKRGDLVAARNLLKAGADPNEGRRGISFSTLGGCAPEVKGHLVDRAFVDGQFVTPGT